MLLFRSEEHVSRWSEMRGIGVGAFLTLEQGWGLGRTWYEDRLSPDWRRRKPEEAEEVFESLGLTGDFWRPT
jgi:Alkylmercury lyase